MKTKYGNAKVDNKGYYIITTGKEGNNGKYLHRLIWEDWYGKSVPDGYVIHHLNGNKTDNRIQNLQCVEQRLHKKFHARNMSDEIMKNMSQSRNSSGYFRVCKEYKKECKQGFYWKYMYNDKYGKRRKICATDISKLEEKVKSKGLVWEKF